MSHVDARPGRGALVIVAAWCVCIPARRARSSCARTGSVRERARTGSSARPRAPRRSGALDERRPIVRSNTYAVPLLANGPPSRRRRAPGPDYKEFSKRRCFRRRTGEPGALAIDKASLYALERKTNREPPRARARAIRLRPVVTHDFATPLSVIRATSRCSRRKTGSEGPDLRGDRAVCDSRARRSHPRGRAPAIDPSCPCGERDSDLRGDGDGRAEGGRPVARRKAQRTARRQPFSCAALQTHGEVVAVSCTTRRKTRRRNAIAVRIERGDDARSCASRTGRGVPPNERSGSSSLRAARRHDEVPGSGIGSSHRGASSRVRRRHLGRDAPEGGAIFAFACRSRARPPAAASR